MPDLSTSSRQVRAWLDTVLNPLSESLEDEIAFVEQRRPTFRQHLRDLEGILDTRTIVGRRYERNLDQVRRYHPTFARWCDKHDEARSVLADACRAAFDTLMVEPNVQGVMAPAATEARPYLAEYLIEGRGELPSRYSLADVWRDMRDQLSRLMEQEPELERLRRRIDEALSGVGEAAEGLLGHVNQTIVDLADQHQLAPVERVG